MIEIQRMGSDAWERVRAIRLRALGDAPDAFGTTLAEAEAMAPERWRERLASTEAVTFVASSDGEDVGLVTGAPCEGRATALGLFGMWVAPEKRSSGVADRLVDALVAWARTAGYARILLDVADDNVAAIRLYERKGSRPTGLAGTLPAPRTHIREHERVLEL